MKTSTRHVFDNYMRLRGEGHTRLLARAVAVHLNKTQDRVIVLLAQHGDMPEVQDQIVEELETLGGRPMNGLDCHRFMDRVRFKSVNDDVVGLRAPIIADNHAVIALCEEGLRQESRADQLEHRLSAAYRTIEILEISLDKHLAEEERLTRYSRRLELDLAAADRGNDVY